MPIKAFFIDIIMNYKEVKKIVFSKKWLIFWMVVLGAVLVFDLMVIQTPKYKANSKILIIQKQTAGQDTNNISTHYLARVLKEVVYSDSFFEKIIQSPHNVEEADFSVNLRERRKEWEKIVQTLITRDLGVIEINILYPNKEKAEQINRAVTDVLLTDHKFYHGSGQNIELKILNYPMVNEKPIISSLWFGLFLGALIGFLISIGWVLIKEAKYIIGQDDLRSGEGFTSIGEEIAKRKESILSQKHEVQDR